MRRHQRWSWVFLGSVLCAASACNGDRAEPPDGAVPDAATPDAGQVDAAPGVSYAATAIVGGLDRIRISKADIDTDRCVVLRLVHPEIADDFDVTLPEDWSVEIPYFAPGTQSCHENPQIPITAVEATVARGEITWTTPAEVYPASLSVDVTLEFGTEDPLIVEELVVTDLPVTQ